MMSKVKALGLAALLLAPTLQAQDDVEVIRITQGATGSAEQDIGQLVQQLQDEVSQLRGLVEAQQFELNRLREQQREMYSDLDRRLSLVATQPTAPVAAEAELEAAEVAEAEQAGDASASSDKQAYQQAFALVRSQSFPEAQIAFSEFIARHPQSAMLPNAYYWLGEVQLARGDLEGAQKAFTQVVNQYGDSNKAADAMFKLGSVFHRKGEAERASKYWQGVISVFPDTRAAKLAANALK